jgi:hypothetical protein
VIGEWILLHFSIRGVVQEEVGIIVAELPIASIIIAPAVPREFVNEGHVNYQVAFPGEVDISDL